MSDQKSGTPLWIAISQLNNYFSPIGLIFELLMCTVCLGRSQTRDNLNHPILFLTTYMPNDVASNAPTMRRHPTNLWPPCRPAKVKHRPHDFLKFLRVIARSFNNACRAFATPLPPAWAPVFLQSECALYACKSVFLMPQTWFPDFVALHTPAPCIHAKCWPILLSGMSSEWMPTHPLWRLLDTYVDLSCFFAL